GFATWPGFTAQSVSRFTNLSEAILNHCFHRAAELGGVGPQLGNSRHALRLYRPQLLLPFVVATTKNLRQRLAPGIKHHLLLLRRRRRNCFTTAGRTGIMSTVGSHTGLPGSQ